MQTFLFSAGQPDKFLRGLCCGFVFVIFSFLGAFVKGPNIKWLCVVASSEFGREFVRSGYFQCCHETKNEPRGVEGGVVKWVWRWATEEPIHIAVLGFHLGWMVLAIVGLIQW